MRVLVVGGTKFLGRALVDAALGHGHGVTLFNRGKTNPGLYPGLELIRGDRRHDAQKLTGRAFDLVIDVAGMDPDEVGPIVEVLRGSASHYVFISTVSVYADHSGPQSEGDPVILPGDALSPGQPYGAGKAAAEKLVVEAFGERALVVRPGLIVGPHDPTDRFPTGPAASLAVDGCWLRGDQAIRRSSSMYVISQPGSSAPQPPSASFSAAAKRSSPTRRPP
jgi:2'-hydroxyisoflavone reductase